MYILAPSLPGIVTSDYTISPTMQFHVRKELSYIILCKGILLLLLNILTHLLLLSLFYFKKKCKGIPLKKFLNQIWMERSIVFYPVFVFSTNESIVLEEIFFLSLFVSILFYCTVMYIMYCTIYNILYCNVLYCTVPYDTVLYWTVLNFTEDYCIVLYCTVYCPFINHQKSELFTSIHVT